MAAKIKAHSQLARPSSGLIKILFPDGNATAREVEELRSFIMEARRRVREHILRIDDISRGTTSSTQPSAEARP